jgi:CO/xanthine dehydrogenase FAD-binding subunit
VAEARLALASVGPVPIRLASAEAALTVAELTDAAIHDAAAAVLEEISPIDDIRGSAAYRRRVVPGLLGRAARRCAERAGVPVALKEASWN